MVEIDKLPMVVVDSKWCDDLDKWKASKKFPIKIRCRCCGSVGVTEAVFYEPLSCLRCDKNGIYEVSRICKGLSPKEDELMGGKNGKM